ncbi:MAG: 2-amino-4-hydroxy-6-hydroxymethyldihydropteridine diphosphokinase [Gammaproteobacteria bacterium]|nr:2-amino-4-hydroxy-6-hydroxymethyldihydropteridine diphosphokinase [Gammaproteobacteria bacterium]
MSPIWRAAYAAIGSNLNNPRERVLEALTRLSQVPSMQSVLASRLYRSHPMGPQDQPEFVNAAAGFVTQLNARELLDAMLDIERSMGRTRAERWGPRVIDLDLIWMVGAATEQPGLSLPHPGVSSRNFVLYPLADFAPMLKIPGLGLVLDLKSAAGDAGISVL